jgi:PEP-CTERM motif-containing protein
MNNVCSNLRSFTSNSVVSRCFLSIVLPMLLLIISATSNASTIVFDNLAPSPQYYFNFGNWSGSLTPNTYGITAMNFTPSAGGTLDELDLGYTDQKIVNTVNATLRLSPEIGGMPSAPIWTGSVLPTGTFGQLTTLTGIGGPTLVAGQTYWLEAFPPNDGITLHGWYTNNQGDLGSIIGSGNYIANTSRFALRVGVNTVPEPSTLALAILGLVATGCFAKTLRRGRHSADPSQDTASKSCSTEGGAEAGSKCTGPVTGCGSYESKREAARPFRGRQSSGGQGNGRISGRARLFRRD